MEQGKGSGEKKEGKTEQEIKRAGKRHKKPWKVFLCMDQRMLHAWYTL